MVTRGSRNTFTGYEAGFTTSADDNVFLGYQRGDEVKSGSRGIRSMIAKHSPVRVLETGLLI